MTVGQSAIGGIQAYISFRFQVFPCFCVYPSLSTCDGSRVGETMPEKVGWCARGHSPRESQGSAAWNCTGGAPIKCTSKDMSGVVPCWYHTGRELCAAVVALRHFTLRGSSFGALAVTVVSVKVHRRVKTDRMAVFGVVVVPCVASNHGHQTSDATLRTCAV